MYAQYYVIWIAIINFPHLWRIFVAPNILMLQVIIPRTKWIRGMAQALESLLPKCKALSSNPCTMKRNKKKIVAIKPVSESKLQQFGAFFF
jgi:hypothetical protein